MTVCLNHLPSLELVVPITISLIEGCC